eukprot:277330-Rhodomonas_salina.1
MHFLTLDFGVQCVFLPFDFGVQCAYLGTRIRLRGAGFDHWCRNVICSRPFPSPPLSPASPPDSISHEPASESASAPLAGTPFTGMPPGPTGPGVSSWAGSRGRVSSSS